VLLKQIATCRIIDGLSNIEHFPLTQENKDFATGSKTCYLHEIECADSESEVKICLGRLDLKL
jgi:hypothetical protein